jgi:transcriptional regulator with XRE-family HTH domain
MGTEKDTFGEYLRKLRLRAGFGLRRFANLIEMKASNLCDIEHGRRSMPKEYLEAAAEALGLEKRGAERKRLFDLARKVGELPADLQRIARRRLMPALLRTIDNAQLSNAEIDALIKDIQGGERRENESSQAPADL